MLIGGWSAVRGGGLIDKAKIRVQNLKVKEGRGLFSKGACFQENMVVTCNACEKFQPPPSLTRPFGHLFKRTGRQRALKGAVSQPEHTSLQWPWRSHVIPVTTPPTVVM